MKFKNSQMEQMLKQLQPILQQRNKVGYVAARNTRMLRDILTEFFSFRNDLVRTYGSDEIDETTGHKTGRITITPDSPNFSVFTEELDKVASIDHGVELMKLKYDEVIDILSGEEILEIEWMLED